jgi:hypothetical protein
MLGFILKNNFPQIKRKGVSFSFSFIAIDIVKVGWTAAANLFLKKRKVKAYST